MKRTGKTKRRKKMKKQHLFKTAYVKGLYRCCIALLRYDEEHDRYLAETPFGTQRWYKASELEHFVL